MARIEEAGLKLNPEVYPVEYLGYIITSHGLRAAIRHLQVYRLITDVLSSHSRPFQVPYTHSLRRMPDLSGVKHANKLSTTLERSCL